MSFKKTILFLHRWLGLITGLIVLLLSITGCLFVFQYEITNWYRGDMVYVDQATKSSTTLPVKDIYQKAANELGMDNLKYGLVTYKNPNRTWTALKYSYQPGSWTYMGMAKEYKTAYVNPYNGQVQGVANEKTDFFQIVKGLHWSLLLATPIGQPIVTWTTLLFIFLLITGMVLWWPKKWNRAGKQRSFKIKWGSTWRRINYDLHNVLGFYFLFIAVIIAFTGLYWYFPSAKKAIHFIGTGEFSLPEDNSQKVVSKFRELPQESQPLEIAFATAWQEYPKAKRIQFKLPSDSAGTITATVNFDTDTYYHTHTLQFDQYTGQLLSSDLFSEKNAGEKLLAMNYDIHVGAIGGIPGKIIAFLGSLVCASLPITGFIIWWDREQRARRRKNNNRPEIAVPDADKDRKMEPA